MGRAPGYDKKGLKKGPWTPEEDQKLIDYINRHGHQSWSSIPERAGLPRCSKSCRLRWVNYLRPDIKRGDFSLEEQQTIIQLHSEMGNKWSAIAARLPGRTDNEIKNYWHTQLKKRLIQMGIDPVTHGPTMHPANVDQLFGSGALRHVTAVLQEAVTREYLRIVAEAMMLQQTDGYTQVELVDEINSTKPPTRSLPQNSLPKPDFIPTPLLSQICTPAPENRLGSPQYNTLVFHAPDQIQSRPQTIQKMQYLSPESNLHSLDTEQVGQDNYTASHSAPIITNRANMISDEKFKGNETHSNILNACSLPCQQHSESHGINSSVALATSEVWPHENLFHFSKSDSEPLPTLVSPTSSQTILNDSCLVTDNSSPVGNTKLSNTADTSTGTSNDSYLSPPAFLFDFPESSKKNDNVSDMQSFENGRDYWTNMLKYVPESSLDSNLDMQSSDY